MLARSIKKWSPAFALLAALGLSACSGHIPGLYRIPIQQGNVITVEMLQELKIGMDKRKVSFILGTPLVIDAFHLDRWDYFYSYEAPSGDRVQQRASLFFENEQLARIEANIDSKIDFHTVTEASGNALIVPPKKKSGFFAALTPAFLERDEENAEQDAIAKSLSSGVDEDQPGSPGSESSPEVLDPALPAPAESLPGIGAGATPSEAYAPNTSAAYAEPAATPAAPDTGAGAVSSTPAVSARTESQSRYLEKLFDNFGNTPVSEAAAAPAQPEVSDAAPPEAPVSAPSGPATQPIRD